MNMLLNSNNIGDPLLLGEIFIALEEGLIILMQEQGIINISSDDAGIGITK